MASDAGMTINAIQFIFAFGELSNRLIIILQAIVRLGLVGALDKSHRSQVIIAAVMASVALGIWNFRCQFMDLALRKRIDVWSMACRATGQPIKLRAVQRGCALMWQNKQSIPNFWMKGFVDLVGSKSLKRWHAG